MDSVRKAPWPISMASVRRAEEKREIYLAEQRIRGDLGWLALRPHSLALLWCTHLRRSFTSYSPLLLSPSTRDLIRSQDEQQGTPSGYPSGPGISRLSVHPQGCAEWLCLRREGSFPARTHDGFPLRQGKVRHSVTVSGMSAKIVRIAGQSDCVLCLNRHGRTRPASPNT